MQIFSAGRTSGFVTAQYMYGIALVAVVYVHHNVFSFIGFAFILTFDGTRGQEIRVDKFYEMY